MMPATLSIITNAFPANERGKAIGTWAGVSAIALALGPVLGGWLTEDVSWRAIFFLNLPVAAGAIAVTLYATHESRDETVGRSVDVPGILALTVSLTALILALVEGNAWGWTSPAILTLFATFVVALVGFVAIERRSAAPIVDFQLLRARQFVGASIVAFMVTFSMFATFFFLALYMQNILRFSPLEAGVRFLPSTLMIIVVGPISGRLTDKIGPRPLMVTGLLLTSGAMFWQSRIDTDTSYGYLLPAFILTGLGMGIVMSPMTAAAMNAVDKAKAGLASGTLSMFRMVGGSFGVAALGALVAGVGRHKIDQLIPTAPEAVRERLADGLGSGATPSGTTPQVADAVREAFVSSLSAGMVVGAIAAAVAAGLTWWLIAPGVPAHDHDAVVPPVQAPDTPVAEPEPQTVGV
jgi:EmrB/QacA subfamily drug resistance transporter